VVPEALPPVLWPPQPTRTPSTSTTTTHRRHTGEGAPARVLLGILDPPTQGPDMYGLMVFDSRAWLYSSLVRLATHAYPFRSTLATDWAGAASPRSQRVHSAASRRSVPRSWLMPLARSDRPRVARRRDASTGMAHHRYPATRRGGRSYRAGSTLQTGGSPVADFNRNGR
jgi:hypothetical protein